MTGTSPLVPRVPAQQRVIVAGDGASAGPAQTGQATAQAIAGLADAVSSVEAAAELAANSLPIDIQAEILATLRAINVTVGKIAGYEDPAAYRG